MVAKLVVEEGDLKGLSLSLEDGETWTIGRDPDECQLVIEDPLVSRKHFIARRTSAGIVVENLSTTGYTLVNDEDIQGQSRLLQNGDTLKVGNEILRFYEDSSIHVSDEEEEMTDSEFEEIEDQQDDDKMTPLPKEENISKFESPPVPLNNPAPRQDTLLEEDDHLEQSPLAEINFGVIETGRWLLKVVGGPNNGAEFDMQTNNSYVLGTDAQSCDIVFHDTSVSRQHARITITAEDSLVIEDLKSRNGILINSTPVENKQELLPNTIVTLGTTSFIIYDREGETQTIISPLLPSIIKVLQQSLPTEKTEETTSLSTDEPEAAAATEAPPKPIEEEKPIPKTRQQFGPYIALIAVIGLFVLAGIGTSALFREEPVVVQTQENAKELIEQALQPFPAIRWTFNKSNNSLLLLGHLSTLAEKNQLFYNLGNLKFIKNIDDSGIVIDEGVWNEVNSLLASNPAWKGITMYSPAAGQFILSGELQTRKQADQLSSYLSLNFPYLDLLKKQIIVEEDVINQIHIWLREAQLLDVVPKLVNGELTLNGTVIPEKVNDLNQAIQKIKQIPGVRIVTNLVRNQTVETGMTDLSDVYSVTGKSRIGNKHTVVINGRILSEGDDLDGMTIIKVTTNQIYLEKDGQKFRINY